MKKYTLQAKKRDVKKEKPASLRKKGIIPATVYGKKVASESLSIALADFVTIYNVAHETGLVELVVDGVIKPVLIHTVQKDPVIGSMLHIEFHQVDLKEKVHANVPLVLVGEAPAVVQKIGVVLTLLSEVAVEALPTHLPEKLDVDISALSEVGQELKVSQIQASADVVVITDASVVVARVGELVSKAAEEQAAAEMAAASTTPEGAESHAESGDADNKEVAEQHQAAPENKEGVK